MSPGTFWIYYLREFKFNTKGRKFRLTDFVSCRALISWSAKCFQVLRLYSALEISSTPNLICWNFKKKKMNSKNIGSGKRVYRFSGNMSLNRWMIFIKQSLWTRCPESTLLAYLYKISGEKFGPVLKNFAFAVLVPNTFDPQTEQITDPQKSLRLRC